MSTRSVRYFCGGSVNGKTNRVLGGDVQNEHDAYAGFPSLTIVPSLVGNGAKVAIG